MSMTDDICGLKREDVLMQWCTEYQAWGSGGRPNEKRTSLDTLDIQRYYIARARASIREEVRGEEYTTRERPLNFSRKAFCFLVTTSKAGSAR